MRTLLLAAASAVSLAVAAPAHATPTQYDVSAPNVFANGAVGVTIHSGTFSERVQAGQFTISAKDVVTGVISALQVYCTDIFDHLSTPSRYNRSTLSATVDDYATIAAIGALIENGNKLVHDAITGAALQLAVWDVLYEGYTGGNDVTKGSFYATNVDSTVLAAANLDITHVNDGSWKLGAGSTVYELLPTAGESQYLSYVAVPEPATLTLLGLGAAGLAFARRRRRAV